MDLNDKNICFVVAYAAPYGGNFIKMLIALANALTERCGCKILFIFPVQKDKEWLYMISQKYKVEFISSDVKTAEGELLKYFNDYRIDLIHTHFEKYDVAVAKSVRQSKQDIVQIWHIHDCLSFDKTGLSLPKIRKFFTNQRFWYQYGKWGKNAFFISVSKEMAHFVNHYRRHRFSYPKEFDDDVVSSEDLIRTEHVLNGIDTDRIHGDSTAKPKDSLFTFLTFGGEALAKGIREILDACEKLTRKNIKLRLLITEGYTTEKLLVSRYGDNLPEWVEVLNHTNDITSLYSQADCYISASKRETMSMAVAEASLIGLPVIQSDIPGTAWNAGNPSTFLFPMDDVGNLAEQMENVMNLTKSGEIWPLVTETKRRNQERLSMDKWVDKIIEIYQNI